MKCKDWFKDVSLSVDKRRLDSLEDVRNISLKSCKAFLNQFKTSRARFLQIGDKFLNSNDVEFGKDVTENLENISLNTLCEDSFPADERNSNSGLETSVRIIL